MSNVARRTSESLFCKNMVAFTLLLDQYSHFPSLTINYRSIKLFQYLI